VRKHAAAMDADTIIGLFVAVAGYLSDQQKDAFAGRGAAPLSLRAPARVGSAPAHAQTQAILQSLPVLAAQLKENLAQGRQSREAIVKELAETRLVLREMTDLCAMQRQHLARVGIASLVGVGPGGSAQPPELQPAATVRPADSAMLAKGPTKIELQLGAVDGAGRTTARRAPPSSTGGDLITDDRAHRHRPAAAAPRAREPLHPAERTPWDEHPEPVWGAAAPPAGAAFAEPQGLAASDAELRGSLQSGPVARSAAADTAAPPDRRRLWAVEHAVMAVCISPTAVDDTARTGGSVAAAPPAAALAALALSSQAARPPVLDAPPPTLQKPPSPRPAPPDEATRRALEDARAESRYMQERCGRLEAQIRSLEGVLAAQRHAMDELATRNDEGRKERLALLRGAVQQASGTGAHAAARHTQHDAGTLRRPESTGSRAAPAGSHRRPAEGTDGHWREERSERRAHESVRHVAASAIADADRWGTHVTAHRDGSSADWRGPPQEAEKVLHAGGAGMESEDEFAYERGDDSGDGSGDYLNRGGLQQSEGGARHEHTHEDQDGETRESSAADAVDDAVTSPGFGGAGGREHAQASPNTSHNYIGRAGGSLAQPSGIATAGPSLPVVSLTRGLPPRSPVLHAQRQRPHRQESAAFDDVVDDVEP